MMKQVKGGEKMTQYIIKSDQWADGLNWDLWIYDDILNEVFLRQVKQKISSNTLYGKRKLKHSSS